MNINEATMSVNIAGVPRPFRIITKDQGKKEYGAPFYEEVTKGVKSLADRIKAENPDTRTARAWLKAMFEQLGVEPVGQAGFLTQLMRFKDAAAMAEALYDITIDDEGNQSTVVGEAELHEKQAVYAESWARQSEDERSEHLTKAGYDGEELAAYKKFDWENLPPAVRTHVEVVLEGTGYNGGTAGLRMGMNPKYRTDAPAPEEKPAEEPEEEPADEEPADEEPAEEEPAEEEPKDAVFESQAAYTDYFRKMAGLTEAEPSGGEVPSPDPVPLDPAQHKRKETPPEVLALIADVKAGDIIGQKKMLTRYGGLIRHNAKDITAKYKLNQTHTDDLLVRGQMALMKAAKDFDPSKGASFDTFATTVIRREQVAEAKVIFNRRKREQSGQGGDDAEDGEGSAIDLAVAMAQADELPPACMQALNHLLDTKVNPKYAQAVRLAFKLGETDDPEQRAADVKRAQDLRAMQTAKTRAKKSAAWSQMAEAERVKLLEKAGYDSEEAAQYVKNEFDTLPLDVQKAVGKVMPRSMDEGGPRGSPLPRSLDAVASIMGVADAAHLFKLGMKELQAAVEADPKLLQPCFDFISSTSYDSADVARRVKARSADSEVEPDEDEPEDDALLELLKFLTEAAGALEYPSEMVAKNMAAILVDEGVKIKRKGKRITIPVNEYGRAKKAFEKAGLTMPKKYVSHEADNIRKMASFSGQYGGGVDSLS